MGKNRFPREFYVPKGSTKIADKKSSAVVYVYESAKVPGRLGACAFSGKADKPAFHYTYRSLANRDNAIAQHFENVRSREARVIDRRAARKTWTPPYKVGDLFKTCWGYDQTNIEYFELVELKGKMGVLREIAQERTETGFMQGKCVPVPGQYIGQPIRKLAQEGGFKMASYSWARYVEPKEVAGCKVYDSGHWTAYA